MTRASDPPGTCYETITTWAAVPGPGGGWYGSKPPQSLVCDDPDYPHAVARARIDSLLPGVHDVQIIRNGRSIETWTGGARRR